jgi:thymidylate synthase (FAD)
MVIIEQSWEWIQKPELPLLLIEKTGRTCYKSESSITENSAIDFCRMILKKGHESVIEHVSASVRFITNRGVTHELVRHRLCSYSQESTRFVKYNAQMEFIKPVWWDDWNTEAKNCWIESLQSSESAYLKLIELGSDPQKAREVLPNSLKTEIVATANLRQWRHIFTVRCSANAHPQIRQLMLSCFAGFRKEFPVLFEDINLS